MAAKILSVQTEPILNEPLKNLQKVEKMLDDFFAKKALKGGFGADLIVLNEFFLTGISKNYTDFPLDKEGGFAVEFLKKLAVKYNSNFITGTIVVKDNKENEGERLYNRMFVLDRSGKTVMKYDKIHLFKYFGGSENVNITPGENPPVTVDLDIGRVGLSICFDIKYPLHYRKLAQMGAQAVVSPSAWAYLKNTEGQKETNTGVFRAMNIARAFENSFYFITANEGGKAEGSLFNTGHSMITGPAGEILAEAGENDEIICANCDLHRAKALQKEAPSMFEE